MRSWKNANLTGLRSPGSTDLASTPMPRPLTVIPDDPLVVLPALRAALAADGPAILPLAGDADHTGVPDRVEQRVALVVQTSGSTGVPKRVALSADAVLASAAASDSALGGPGQWLLALPAHYIAGINVLVRSIAAGTDPVILQGASFDPHAFVAAAESMDHAVRYTALVPVQLARLLDTDAALPALRRFDRILVGGQSTPKPLLDRARGLGVKLTRTYGSTETSGGCVYDGVPIGSTEVRIDIADGGGGEILLGGPTLAEGYLDAALTEQRFVYDDGAHWFRTGDTGSMDDGVLRVTGRLDDVIVSGGLKVSLFAVERTVRAHPELADAVVAARADATWGQVPVVIATARFDLAVLRAEVEGQLGKAARPAALIVVDAIPHLASGKPDRLALAAIAESAAQ